MTSTSIRDWARQRFRLELYLPLVAFLESARFAIAPDRTDTGRRLALALASLFALRLADDVASAARDARDHPDRPRPPGRAVILVPAALAIAMAWPSSVRLALLAGLAGAAAVFYRFDARAADRGLVGSIAVLAKYPALVVLLADGMSSRRDAIVLVVVFACFVVYELAEDAALRSARAVHATAGLVVVAGLGALAHGLWPIAAVVVAAIVTIAVVRTHRFPWLVFLATAAAFVLVTR